MSERDSGRHGRQTFLTWAGSAVVIMTAVASVAAAAVLAGRQHERGAVTGQPPAGIPATIPSGTVSLMGLSLGPANLAPGFALTDQDGRTLPLSDFRGKVVVLEFMDSRCTDICPLVSREFIDAYHDLGRAAGNVVFAAVNVNGRYNGVPDVLAYSRAHRLTTIPDWYFFTGSAGALQTVWRAYDIAVAASAQGTLVHTAAVYFISPRGTERYIADPVAEHTAGGATYLPSGQLSGWGQGIAQVAETMLG